MLGTYEYPDFPMDTETFGVKPGEHIPGTVLHEYLTKFAEKFDILDKIRFSTKVISAEHQEGSDGGWILTVQHATDSSSEETKIMARKLIVATGLTSEAFLPDFAGQETFGVPIFHGSKDFPQHADTIKTAKTVTVFGGTKSAWDAVYAYATQGVKVNWVIRGIIFSVHVDTQSIRTNYMTRNGPRACLDGTSICHAIEEVAREARP
jgi:cation diffusion facilitator CzcD-associated flavoprotein CzcO